MAYEGGLELELLQVQVPQVELAAAGLHRAFVVDVQFEAQTVDWQTHPVQLNRRRTDIELEPEAQMEGVLDVQDLGVKQQRTSSIVPSCHELFLHHLAIPTCRE